MLQLVDLLHVLVLDPEVLQLGFHLPDAVLDLVLLLHGDDQLVKVLLQPDDLLVDRHSHFVFLGLVEDEVLDVRIDALDTCHDTLGVPLNLADLFQDALDLRLLSFQVSDDFVDALQVLVTVQVFR